MNASFFTLSFSFFLYGLAQVILFRNIALFDLAFCFIYVGFIIKLPFEINKAALMIVSFALGLGVDVFYDTAGVHASACVFLAFVRPYLLQVVSPQGGYDLFTRPSISELGWTWFLSYTSIALLLHHGVLFAMQDYNFSLWLYHIPSILASVVVGTFLLTLIQFLFYKKQ